MKRGNWIVLVLLGIGVVAAVVAVSYRALVIRRSQPGAQTAATQPGGAGGWDRDAAAEQLMAIQDQYVRAGDGGDVSGIALAAQNLVERYPLYAEAHRLLAQTAIDAGDNAKARQELARSLDLDPNQPEVHLMVGDLALKGGDADSAESSYKKAITLKPTEGRYRMHLANAYSTKGERDKARNLYLDALRLDTSLHQAYAGLADLYTGQNQLQLALTEIGHAIENTPTKQRTPMVVYIRRKAGLLRRDNRPAEALTVLETLSSQERLDPDVIEETAVTWALLGKPGHGATLYEEALSSNPVHWRYAAGAALWRLKAGDRTSAQRHLRLLKKLDPNLPVIAEIEKQLH